MYLPQARASGMSRPALRPSATRPAFPSDRARRLHPPTRRNLHGDFDGSAASNQPPGTREHGLVRQIGRERSVEGSGAKAQRNIAEVTQRDLPRPCGEIQHLSARVAVLHMVPTGAATAIGRTPGIPEADYGPRADVRHAGSLRQTSSRRGQDCACCDGEPSSLGGLRGRRDRDQRLNRDESQQRSDHRQSLAAEVRQRHRDAPLHRSKPRRAPRPGAPIRAPANTTPVRR